MKKLIEKIMTTLFGEKDDIQGFLGRIESEGYEIQVPQKQVKI